MENKQVFDEIQDNRLQRFLKQEIRKRPEYSYALRTLVNCCHSTIKTPQGQGVHIISNGKQAKILGIRACHHSWTCPHCTAKEMRKHGQNIGAAIEALKKYDLVPIMITLTVFHTNTEPLEKVVNLLRQTYNLFNKQASSTKKYKHEYKYQDESELKLKNFNEGSIKSYKKRKKKYEGKETIYANGGTWSRFWLEFSINHMVKVMEVNYGTHGWHPHYHNLYWIPKNRLKDIITWEEELKAQWRKCEDKIAKKIFTEEYYQKRKIWYDSCDKSHKLQRGYTEGLYISRDENNNAAEIKASDYICGWGGDDELTNEKQKQGGLKRGKNGHYTLHQMLEEAYYKNDTKLLEKYLEFAKMAITERLHRIDYSRTGLKEIIATYKKTEAYRDCMKKKRTYAAGIITPYHTVCYFKSEDWKEICHFNIYSQVPIIELILRFATYDNGFNLIYELMKINNLPTPLEKSPTIDLAEIYNDMLEHQWDYEDDQEPNTKRKKDVAQVVFKFLNDTLKSFAVKNGAKILGYNV